MATYTVVIGTSSIVDRSVVVGPFRNRNRAIAAAGEMDAQGYVTEIADCQTLDDLVAQDWSDTHPDHPE